MVKLIIECAIFTFILVQIMSLTSFTNKDDNAVAAGMQNATIAAYGAQDTPAPDPFEAFETVKAVAVPADTQSAVQLAQTKANRIVQGGDIDGFMTELDRNPAAKFLLGL